MDWALPSVLNHHQMFVIFTRKEASSEYSHLNEQGLSFAVPCASLVAACVSFDSPKGNSTVMGVQLPITIITLR